MEYVYVPYLQSSLQAHIEPLVFLLTSLSTSSLQVLSVITHARFDVC